MFNNADMSLAKAGDVLAAQVVTIGPEVRKLVVDASATLARVQDVVNANEKAVTELLVQSARLMAQARTLLDRITAIVDAVESKGIQISLKE